MHVTHLQTHTISWCDVGEVSLFSVSVNLLRGCNYYSHLCVCDSILQTCQHWLIWYDLSLINQILKQTKEKKEHQHVLMLEIKGVFKLRLLHVSVFHSSNLSLHLPPDRLLASLSDGRSFTLSGKKGCSVMYVTTCWTFFLCMCMCVCVYVCGGGGRSIKATPTESRALGSLGGLSQR